MKRSDGKIGGQETLALTGIAVYMSTVFTVPGEAYAHGNSSYFWLPAGMLLALCATLVTMAAMRRRGAETLNEMMNSALGGALGKAAALILMLLMFWNALTLASTFIDMTHGFEYSASGYWNIAIWGLGAVFLLNAMGFECIARTAKCMLPLLVVTFVLTVLPPLKAASPARLYPFPGNTAGEMARLALTAAFRAFGATIAAAVISREAQGVQFARRSCTVATVAAAAMGGITQLVIAVTFQYKDLADIYMPIYRLDMMLVREGYFFRPDTILLFLWLIGSLIAAAYYLYTAALLWRRVFSVGNNVPVAALLCMLTGCGVLLKYEAYYAEYTAINAFLEKWGWLAALPPLAAAGISFIKKKNGREAEAK